MRHSSSFVLLFCVARGTQFFFIFLFFKIRPFVPPQFETIHRKGHWCLEATFILFRFFSTLGSFIHKDDPGFLKRTHLRPQELILELPHAPCEFVHYEHFFWCACCIFVLKFNFLVTFHFSCHFLYFVRSCAKTQCFVVNYCNLGETMSFRVQPLSCLFLVRLSGQQLKIHFFQNISLFIRLPDQSCCRLCVHVCVQEVIRWLTRERERNWVTGRLLVCRHRRSLWRPAGVL